MTLFADLILPLPLNRTFTYSIPEYLSADIFIGSRIIVQFGKKKFYTAIVMNIHNNKPQEYEVKQVYAILDSKSIVTPIQLRLWQWIASSYLFSLGYAYKAAIPSVL